MEADLPHLSGPVQKLVHCGPLAYWHDAFWCWWAISQRAMRAHRVVVPAPAFDQDLGKDDEWLGTYAFPHQPQRAGLGRGAVLGVVVVSPMERRPRADSM